MADFYENKHTNSDLMTCNFTNLTDDKFYEALMEANMTLLDNYHRITSYNVCYTKLLRLR